MLVVASINGVQIPNGSNKHLLCLKLMLSDTTDLDSTHRRRFMLVVAYAFHRVD